MSPGGHGAVNLLAGPVLVDAHDVVRDLPVVVHVYGVEEDEEEVESGEEGVLQADVLHWGAEGVVATVDLERKRKSKLDICSVHAKRGAERCQGNLLIRSFRLTMQIAQLTGFAAARTEHLAFSLA